MESAASNQSLRALGVQSPRAEAISEDGFQAEDGGFSQRAFVVATLTLPAASSVAANKTQVLITRQRRRVAVALLPDAPISSGRDGDSGLGASPRQSLIDRPPVVGPIGRNMDNGAFHLGQQSGHRLGIMPARRAQEGCLDFVALWVHCQMEFAPGAPPRPAMLTHFPFALSIDLQPAAVQRQMERPAGLLRQAHLQPATTPRKGGVVRHRQIHPKQGEQRTHQSLDGTVGQMKDFPQAQHALDRQVTVAELRTSLEWALIAPMLQDLLVNPQGKRAAAYQGAIVAAPVPNVVSYLPAWSGFPGCLGHTPKDTSAAPFCV